jgi:hypothetical protein
MRVAYRANGDIADLTDEAGRALVMAGIADAAEPTQKEPPKEPKKSDKPTKVEPLSTDDMPPPMTKPKKGL